MSVGIVILQYGNSRATIDCIESVEQYNTHQVKYIVVDNGSPDAESVEAVSRYLNEKFTGNTLELSDGQTSSHPLPKATFLCSSTNDGYARGNNKGLALAYTDDEIDKILILNNDILFVEDIIPRLANDIDTLDDCALVSPLLYKKGLVELDPNCARREGKVRHSFLFYLLLLHLPLCIVSRTYIKLDPNTGLKSIQLISGSCIMCKKSLFRELGSFDPGTFLYYEENILWEKIKRIGLRNYIDTDTRAIHLGAATISKVFSTSLLKQSIKSQNYFVRNYLKHGRAKCAILKISQRWAIGIFAMKNHLLKK